MPNRVRVLLVVTIVAVALPGIGAGVIQSSAQGQTQPASAPAAAAVKGRVVDKDGGLIPGATVLLTRVDTNEKLPTQITNAAGEYSFAGLAPGKYTVTISLQGFKTLTADLTVTAGSTAVLQTKLEVGQVSEVVNVTAGTDLVRMDTPKVTQTVSANFIQTLPRSDRNALNFLVFLPGVTTVGGAEGARTNTTVAGLPSKQFNVTIDGVPPPAVQGQLQAQDGFHSLVRPRLDAIEEVTLRSAGVGGETYARFVPNPFQTALDNPLSTFGADVDTASFSNIRRFLSSGQLPPAAAIRTEELINYFRFPYAAPRAGQPIGLTTEIGDCPWAPTHKLALIGARAMAPAQREITGRNIVLLIDVSGSMAPANRLPMIKTALAMFADTLRPTDTLAIVTYAGSSGVALPATPARQRDVIQSAIARMTAGGSTNGAEGLVLAYQIARQSFVKGGVNRVILATDGDFNVGVTSQTDLLALIQREKESGVFLSVFGVGEGNLKDATMEMLADRGNGHYSYLDSLQEARRVLVREGDSTLETVAKDVKFQVEFNPAVVWKYKLLGYETRALAARDFNDDRKDGGEMGAGHTVTVLYEIIPVGVEGHMEGYGDRPEVDPLRYQPDRSPAPRPAPRPVAIDSMSEWFTVKARFKQPDGNTSSLISQVGRMNVRPQHLALASAIAEFGIILRDDPRDTERWDSLAYRLDRITVPPALAQEVDGLRELVATARGLARIR